MNKAFDNDLYLAKQSEKILERIKMFDKLYIEFGGKLFDDLHASRVLPGFDPNAKIKLLQKLKDKLEVIMCISASDIERNKIRADFGITYGSDLLRIISKLKGLGVLVNSVVITKYQNQSSVDAFKVKLERRKLKVYLHTLTKGYPSDINTIVSDEGYGANPYVETKRPLVVITAPGPSSGKLATCLGQLYHEYKKGVKAGYAKFETFPVWNLPLKHPVNRAYEAATADIKDYNMIDPYHLDEYGVSTVNYNRDVEVFPIVKTILSKIVGDQMPYASPTDMGVNMVGYAIMDDEAVCEAAKQEIIRRYFNASCDYVKGESDIETVQRIEIILNEMGVDISERKVVSAARNKTAKCKTPAIAIALNDGTIITGRDSKTMTASSAVIINAIKYLSGIDDDVKLISPLAIEPILSLKKNIYKSKEPMLFLEEALIALSMSSVSNPVVNEAMSKIDKLKGCEAHSSVMLGSNVMQFFRLLGINITCDAKFTINDNNVK